MIDANNKKAKLLQQSKKNWKELIEESHQNLNEIQQINYKISMKIQKKEQYSNLDDLKNDLISFQMQIKTNIKQIKSIINELDEYDNIEVIKEINKLKDNFEKETQKTEQLMKQLIDSNYSEKQIEVRLSQKNKYANQNFIEQKRESKIDDDSYEEQTNQQFQLEQQFRCEEVNLEEMILEERGLAINDLTKFVGEIKELMQYAAVNIEEQGAKIGYIVQFYQVVIDLLSNNMQKTKQNANNALIDIKNANENSKKVAKKTFCCCCCQII